MDFLGIGPLELLFVFIIILIVLGPNDMIKAGATLGRYIRQMMKSETWRVIQDTSREIRGLPTKLARQAGLEEFEKELRDGMEFPKIGDIPKKIEEEMKFDSWIKPAREVPPEKESHARPANQVEEPSSSEPPEAPVPGETNEEAPVRSPDAPSTHEEPDAQAPD